ncbi:MAG: hypothetical protein ABI895_23800 [Deltaproteobacteria bacterium]
MLGLALVVRLGQHFSAAVAALPTPRPPEAPLIWFERAEEPSPVAEAGIMEAGAGEIEPARPAPQRVARAVTPGGSLPLLRTDGSGETVHVELAEASGDTDAWNAVARSLLQALHGKKLRVPPGSGGVTMQLRVVSREQLPSGRDPGLAVDLFGQEVKAGAGDRSTRLQLLTPKITLEQYQISPTDPHVKIPVIGFSFTILGVQGDLVDIGSVARRVVHSHLVSLETHPREPEQ